MIHSPRGQPRLRVLDNVEGPSPNSRESSAILVPILRNAATTSAGCQSSVGFIPASPHSDDWWRFKQGLQYR
ncbi:hypothetical protein Xmau_04587 [Xenorhabdus mauleonii]|uniref:Uncharacterized protein n=1 Tax=Xenorhabdus mauleonii TaxID=351675 RepID=A0A2G0N653_9GAMM|nr:hypothetical protein Xmau_04587 [Xenorhabdus mauleonii]